MYVYVYIYIYVYMYIFLFFVLNWWPILQWQWVQVQDTAAEIWHTSDTVGTKPSKLRYRDGTKFDRRPDEWQWLDALKTIDWNQGVREICLQKSETAWTRYWWFHISGIRSLELCYLQGRYWWSTSFSAAEVLEINGLMGDLTENHHVHHQIEEETLEKVPFNQNAMKRRWNAYFFGIPKNRHPIFRYSNAFPATL